MHRELAARLFAHGVNQDAVFPYPDATPRFAGRVLFSAYALLVIQPTLAPLCPDYRKLSAIIPRVSAHDVSNCSTANVTRSSIDPIPRRSILRHETRDVLPGWSRERMLLEKEFEPDRVKRILLSFPFSSYTPWDCYFLFLRFLTMIRSSVTLISNIFCRRVRVVRVNRVHSAAVERINGIVVIVKKSWDC